MKENKLIFSSWFQKLGLTINFLDVGARGDISEPWSLFAPNAIKIIGFEPDAVECARLSATHPDRKYYPRALWGDHTTRPFYLCEWASTSSMYPPAEENNHHYRTTHWTGRVPVRTLQVNCVTLDSVLSREDAPDFIKIDTQGAELEILKGASQSLRLGAPLVLAETWCAEVYKGMPLTHDVMAFMYELGYQVFDLNVAAAWQHTNSLLTHVECKGKTIGYDLLFVKRLEFLNFEEEGDLLKFAAVCELFGFRDYAMAVLETSKFESQLKAQALLLMKLNSERDTRANQIWRRALDRLLGRKKNRWPQLH